MRPSATKARSLDRCAAARDLLPAFVEEELADEARRSVRMHLDTCAECSKEEAAYRAALGAFATRTARRPGDLYPGFACRIAAQPRVLLPRATRWAATGACVLIAALAGAVVLRSMAPHGGPPVGPRAATNIADRTGAPTAPKPDAQPTPRAAPAPDRRIADAGASGRTISRVPGATRVRTRRVARASRPATPPTSFLDVRPAAGMTARDQLAVRAAMSRAIRNVPAGGLPTNAADFAPSGPNDKTPQVARYIPTLDEQVRVGDRVTRIRGETGVDDKGRIAVIRVSADTNGPN